MIKFSINYSHPAASLLSDDQIHIDYFKTPPWAGLIREASDLCPVRVHFNLNAGQGPFTPEQLAEVERWMQETGTPYANLHLAPDTDHFPHVQAGETNPRLTEPVVQAMMADILQLVQVFGPERVIVENSPYDGDDGHYLRVAMEPAVIQRLVQETGCGLLLDISHARLAAMAFGMDEYDYLEQLPVQHLRELHFTGLGLVEGHMRDHLPVRPEDWPVLEYVVDQIHSGAWAQPGMLAFEYGGVGEKFAWRSDPAVIAAQVPRIVSILSKA